MSRIKFIGFDSLSRITKYNTINDIEDLLSFHKDDLHNCLNSDLIVTVSAYGPFFSQIVGNVRCSCGLALIALTGNEAGINRVKIISRAA